MYMDFITLINNQKDIPLDIETLYNNTYTILQALEYQDFAISIVFVTNTEMQRYNKQFRNKDKPTDILSFPFYPEINPGDRIKAQSEEEKNLGDIIICPAFVNEDLTRWNQTFDQRMNVLFVHGICHLLGYDHIEDHDYEIMKIKETALLKLL